MPTNMKLIIDKDLGHVLATFAETVSRQPELTLPDLLGTKLPVRSTSQGALQVPREQLVLKGIEVPSAESPVTKKQLLEEPRKYIFRQKRVETEPEAVATSNDTITTITLVKEGSGSKQERTYIRADLSSTTHEVGALVKAKAFAQARNEPEPPQLYENIYGEDPGVEIESRVDAQKTILFVTMPITLLENKQYDVLVLLNGFLASVAEGLTVTNQ